MPDKRESYQPTTTAMASVAANDMPSQRSIDLLIRLLQEFDARSSSTTSNLPPEVERAVAEANAAFDSIKSSLQLLESPVTIAEVCRVVAAGPARRASGSSGRTSCLERRCCSARSRPPRSRSA